MPDRLSAEERSAHMRRICKTDTRPELRVRRLAHALGYRFRLHRRDLPGRPDLVFPRLRRIVLVHGCFWHQHPGCRLARSPKSRLEYWGPKLRRNRERDEAARARLAEAGWTVLTVWECGTRDPDTLAERLRQFLETAPGGRRPGLHVLGVETDIRASSGMLRAGQLTGAGVGAPGGPGGPASMRASG